MTLITAWDDSRQSAEHIEALRDDYEQAEREAQRFRLYAAWNAEAGTDTSLFDRPPHPEQTAWECLTDCSTYVTVTEAPAVFAKLLAVMERDDDDLPY